MYQKIFVAIDDSPTAQKALTEAIDLAGNAKAALCIAHAADESLLAQHGMGLGSYIDVEGTKQAIRDASQALLDAAAAKPLQPELRPRFAFWKPVISGLPSRSRPGPLPMVLT
jgi:nucleotide-binding universal stress UspA family protein